MGKATIKTNIGEGKYLVDLALNTGLRQPAIDKMDAVIKQKNDHTATTQEILDRQIIETGKLVTASGLVVDEIISFQDTYKSTKSGLEASLADADYVVAGAEVEVEDADYILAGDRQELARLEAEKERILALPPPGNVPSAELLNSIAQANANVLAAEQDLTDRKAELAAAVKTRDGIKSQLDGLKSEIPKALQDKMAAAIKAVNDSRYLEKLYKIDLAQTAMDIKSAQLQKKALEALPEKKEMTVWCADYTTDLAGEVATIDIPGEVGAIPTLINPGFTPTPYDKTKDGALVNLELMSPESAWFNLATLPYLNKFKPRFRRAHITSITGDLCDIELETTNTKFTPTVDVTKVMRYEGTGANVAAVGKKVLTKVPFAYMDCHSAAFEVGDFVVVEFTDRDPAKPKVIGFIENPRECNPHGFGVTVDSAKKIIQKKSAVWKVTARDSLSFGTLYRKLKVDNKWYVASFRGAYAGVMLGTMAGSTGNPGLFSSPIICINGRSLSAPSNVIGMNLCLIGATVYIYIVADSSIYRAVFPSKITNSTTLEWTLMGTYGEWNPEGFAQYVTNKPGTGWDNFDIGMVSLWEFNMECTEVAAVFGVALKAGSWQAGYGQIVGIWTNYDTLSLEIIDTNAGTVVVTESHEFVNNVSTWMQYEYMGELIWGWQWVPEPIFIDVHYLSISKIKRILWAGYKTDGVILDVMSFDDTLNMQTPDLWSGEYQNGTVLHDPTPIYYHPNDTNSIPDILEEVRIVSLNDSELYELARKTAEKMAAIRYLDPYLMAAGIVGYEGETPFCGIFKDWEIVLSGDNLTRRAGTDYTKFFTQTSISQTINTEDGWHYQLTEDIDGKLLACINDYSRHYSMYDSIDGFTKAMIITDGTIKTLINNADNIMPMGVI